jgi:hypothetical protein
VLGLAALAIGLTGCPFLALPDTAALLPVEEVTVADGVAVPTPLGAGAAGLADSTWAVYRADDDTLLFRVTFGPDGEIVRIFDSFVFAREWLGSVVIPDGEPHSTAYLGGRYVSGAYAAEQDGDVGVLGVLHGLLRGTHLGTATLSFYGPLGDDRIDGTMARTVMVFAATPFPAPGDAEFAAYALREP